MFGSGEWTCTVANWKGKMIGPWRGLDGKLQIGGHEQELPAVARPPCRLRTLLMTLAKMFLELL
jgi:hypothetical protein